jgi:hypothetical protein
MYYTKRNSSGALDTLWPSTFRMVPVTLQLSRWEAGDSSANHGDQDSQEIKHPIT